MLAAQRRHTTPFVSSRDATLVLCKGERIRAFLASVLPFRRDRGCVEGLARTMRRAST